jgi:hypothetical protein
MIKFKMVKRVKLVIRLFSKKRKLSGAIAEVRIIMSGISNFFMFTPTMSKASDMPKFKTFFQ